jgi:site-specific recombinase XerD
VGEVGRQTTPERNERQTKGQREKRIMAKVRGVYEKVPGSGIHWIRFADANGDIRREKVGPKGAAVKLYHKRKTEVLQGKKFPENLRDRNSAPTLNEFSKRFCEAVKVRHAAKPKTIKFYDEQVKRLLEYVPLASTRLNEIDEALIEDFVQYRSAGVVRHRTKDGIKKGQRQISAATVNRGLATLRRMMRLARTWRVIDRVPEIRLLSGERNRQFVLDHATENVYLEFAPQPLRDVALLLIDTGLRLDEGLSLEWTDVHLTPNGSRWGFIQIRGGKSKNARRAVPLTERTHNLLERLWKESKTALLFANCDAIST